MTSVFLAGRALISALGANLSRAVDSVAQQRPGNTRSFDFAALGQYPVQVIAGERRHWEADVMNSIERAIADAGAASLQHCPLFIATASADIDAMESGEQFGESFFDFCHRIAQRLRWHGPVVLISTACTASTNALLAAHAALVAGPHDAAVVLAVEMCGRYTVGGFAAMQLLSPQRALPFGAHRDGIVLGEAITALVLSRSSSRWRLLGGANVTSGEEPTGADEQALIAMYERALAQCELRAQDIDLIKVQAAGSPSNDAVEAAAIKQIFGDRPALVSLKGLLGHTLAASGAAELALMTACLEARIWPPVNHEMDKSLPLALTRKAPSAPRYSLHSILGFGGGHACVILENMGARA